MKVSIQERCGTSLSDAGISTFWGSNHGTIPTDCLITLPIWSDISLESAAPSAFDRQHYYLLNYQRGILSNIWSFNEFRMPTSRADTPCAFDRQHCYLLNCQHISTGTHKQFRVAQRISNARLMSIHAPTTRFQIVPIAHP